MMIEISWIQEALPAGLNTLFDLIVENGAPDPRKADCYKCPKRGSVPGSAHSACRYFNQAQAALVGLNTFVGNNPINIKMAGAEVPIVGFKAHGWRNGWAFWPSNYDPVWLLWCMAWIKEGQE